MGSVQSAVYTNVGGFAARLLHSRLGKGKKLEQQDRKGLCRGRGAQIECAQRARKSV